MCSIQKHFFPLFFSQELTKMGRFYFPFLFSPTYHRKNEVNSETVDEVLEHSQNRHATFKT